LSLFVAKQLFAFGSKAEWLLSYPRQVRADSRLSAQFEPSNYDRF